MWRCSRYTCHPWPTLILNEMHIVLFFSLIFSSYTYANSDTYIGKHAHRHTYIQHTNPFRDTYILKYQGRNASGFPDHQENVDAIKISVLDIVHLVREVYSISPLGVDEVSVKCALAANWFTSFWALRRCQLLLTSAFSMRQSWTYVMFHCFSSTSPDRFVCGYVQQAQHLYILTKLDYVCM